MVQQNLLNLILNLMFDSKWISRYFYANSKIIILNVLNASVMTFIPVVKYIKQYLLIATRLKKYKFLPGLLLP